MKSACLWQDKSLFHAPRRWFDIPCHLDIIRSIFKKILKCILRLKTQLAFLRPSRIIEKKFSRLLPRKKSQIEKKRKRKKTREKTYRERRIRSRGLLWGLENSPPFLAWSATWQTAPCRRATPGFFSEIKSKKVERRKKSEKGKTSSTELGSENRLHRLLLTIQLRHAYCKGEIMLSMSFLEAQFANSGNVESDPRTWHYLLGLRKYGLYEKQNMKNTIYPPERHSQRRWFVLPSRAETSQTRGRGVWYFLRLHSPDKSTNRRLGCWFWVHAAENLPTQSLVHWKFNSLVKKLKVFYTIQSYLLVHNSFEHGKSLVVLMACFESHTMQKSVNTKRRRCMYCARWIKKASCVGSPLQVV